MKPGLFKFQAILHKLERIPDSECIGDVNAIFVIANSTLNNVADGTLINFGIDGVQPAPFGSPTSTISVVVLDGSTVVDALNFNRIHINSNC